MKKCQAKGVRRVVPGILWGTKEVFGDCPNDAKGTGDYCEEHGCFDCSLKSAKDCLEFERTKLCIECRIKRIFKAKKDFEESKKKLAEEVRKRAEEERLKKDLENLSKERANYAQKLIDLEGWDLLTVDEQSNYVAQIKGSSLDSLNSVLNSAQAAISLIRDIKLERERERQIKGLTWLRSSLYGSKTDFYWSN